MPELTELTLTPDSFTPTRRGAAIVRRGGAALRFRLSRAALVRFEVIASGAAVRRTPTTGGRFSVRAKGGLNRVRFSGRLRGRPLAPGTYVLRAVAIDRAKQVSAPAGARFRISEKKD